MEINKVYKYKAKLSGTELEAVLVKKKDRCYLYLDKSHAHPTSSWDLDRYDDFNFYYILEPFIDPDAMPLVTKDAIVDFLKRL
jgi:hypothetical protein